MSHFSNAYSDPDRAASYSTLGFPATYSLAFRDLPALFEAHGVGPERGPGRPPASGAPARRAPALDFGCGAGRSTRFLLALGYDVIGVDISEAMLERARALDQRPEAAGRYQLIRDDPGDLPPGPFDLILAAYPFDNIPGVDHRAALLRGLGKRLGTEADRGRNGRLALLASSPDLYVREWATFTTAAYPENASAGSGDPVRITIKEGGDPRPVQDLLWFDRDYRAAFDRAGLELLETHRPLATGEEPYEWVSETDVSPWVIYVAGPGRTLVNRA